MHVAFFNRSYYPDQSATGQLLTDLCEDLVSAHGCRVSVVTGVPLLPSEAGGAVRGGILRLFPDEADPIDVLPTRGTLVAFPADMPHEVTPVTSGRRDAIVDWFY